MWEIPILVMNYPSLQLINTFYSKNQEQREHAGKDLPRQYSLLTVARIKETGSITILQFMSLISISLVKLMLVG